MVPETVFKPAVTVGGKTPLILVNEKRSEKLMIVPPVAAETTLMKYASWTSAPTPAVNVTVMELPLVKSPCWTKVAS